jgi:hypothetical protein
MKTYLFILIVLFAETLMAQTTTAEMKEFGEANYLQLDELDVPKGIKRVEDQLRENVIDVIIHSKTHMPIFAQKRPDGYSKSYKKFYGLNIRILPILQDDDFYSLQLFYFNWTTNKFDKKLVKKISKYNVLNELRFATYEILLGKQWVLDHKDEIESRNFERIQAVREVISEQERLKKKKKKEDEIKKLKAEEEEEKKSVRNLIKREEREKKAKKEEVPEEEEAIEEGATSVNKTDLDQKGADIDQEKIKIEENIQKQASSSKAAKKKKAKTPAEVEKENAENLVSEINPEIPEPGVPKKTHFYGFANYFQESTGVRGGLIPTDTDLKYIGAGGRFILERETFIPTGYRVSIQAAMPIFKEKYKFPIYRSVESEVFASRILDRFQFFAGLDFVPVYFVGLPSEGSRLQVYENDFLWLKAGAGVNEVLFNKKVELRFSYLKSLVSKSNQKDKFEATKTIISSYFQIHDSHGAEINFSTMNASGSFDVASKRVAFSYIYKFEN